MKKVVGVLAALVLLVATPARADEIRVMTSGAFTEAYQKLAEQFQKTTHHKVITTFGASMGGAKDSIPVRLDRGEPVDVVIVIDAALEPLIKSGHVVSTSRVQLARSMIGIAVRKGAPKPDISSVAALRQTLLRAKSIAYSASASGTYISTDMFKRLGVADQVKDKAKRIESERVGAVVARGDAEIGFQQVSELLPIAGIDYVGLLPAEVQQVSIVSAAIASRAKTPSAARALIDFLASPAAATTIEKTGLEPIAKAQQPSTRRAAPADGRAELTDPTGDVQPIVYREGSATGPEKEVMYPGFDVIRMAVSSDGKTLTFAATLNAAPAPTAVYPVLEFHVDADNNQKTGITNPDAGTLVGMEFRGTLEVCVDPLTCQSEDMMLNGTIARLLIDKGFGFIRDELGVEHFFLRSAVRGAAFEQLKEGLRVKFAAGESSAGPRASTVVVVDPKRARTQTSVKGHTAIVTLEKYRADWKSRDTLIDLPATLSAKEPRKTPVTGALIQATVDYASMGVTSGQTIRVVVREYCAGKVKNVAQGFFPEIVLKVR
jgi:molybdate transport system substrate-binding protein